jgi:hypothetical protein
VTVAALDPTWRISALVKLKLTSCARAEKRPGLFRIRAEARLFFLLLLS